MSPQQRHNIEALFRKYGRGVGSYVLARVGDVHVAETIASDVFAIVVAKIAQCRSSPAAWLWSIVHSELARHFRNRRPTAPLSNDLPDPAPSPPQSLAHREMQERMRVALSQISEAQQRVIYLKFFLDLSHKEIARELELTTTNVGVIIHRATRELRRLMEEADAPKLQSDGADLG